MYYVHRIGIFDHKRERGMLFCDHTITIEAISVAEHNNINSLQAKTTLKITINIYAA